jgi:hypothetical protein
VRPFDQALRTLRLLSAAEAAPPGAADALTLADDASDAGDVTPPPDAPPKDSGAIHDGAAPTQAVTFESAPAPKIDPIGPCPK